MDIDFFSYPRFSASSAVKNLTTDYVDDTDKTQIERAESEFGDHTRRIKQIFNLGLPERAPTALTILTPLISIAWTDGKVGRNEQDAIVRAADEYGIFDNEDVYLTLMERLTSRPHRELIQKLWAELAVHCEDLDAANCTAFASHLY